MPTVEVPGHGDVEFPDSMSDDQIAEAIKKMPGVPQPRLPGQPHNGPGLLGALQKGLGWMEQKHAQAAENARSKFGQDIGDDYGLLTGMMGMGAARLSPAASPGQLLLKRASPPAEPLPPSGPSNIGPMIYKAIKVALEPKKAALDYLKNRLVGEPPAAAPPYSGGNWTSTASVSAPAEPLPMTPTPPIQAQSVAPAVPTSAVKPALRSAVRDAETGITYTGQTHMHAYESMPDAVRERMHAQDLFKRSFEDGYVTPDGTWVSYTDALKGVRTPPPPPSALPQTMAKAAAPPGNVYELAGRGRKVSELVKAIDSNASAYLGVNPTDPRLADALESMPPEWWEGMANVARINKPSPETVKDAISFFRDRAAQTMRGIAQ